MPNEVKIVSLVGDALQGALPEVAKLRIEVFRDFPYLYDGDLDYETDYLAALIAAKDAIVVVAIAEGTIIGCATGCAIDDQHQAFVEPLLQSGIDLTSTFYFGESVLLPDYRGQGFGHVFFDYREAWAARLNYHRTCFCAVERPDDHPLRPKNYRSLDPFWTKRGYQKLRGARAQFTWRDVNKSREDSKPMQFWMRDLAAPSG